jgi:hypothetical protein
METVGIFAPVRSPGDFKTTRIHEVGAITYFGFAGIGALDSHPVWQIKRLTESGGLLSLQWADGNSEFDNVWDDRASLNYS